VSICPVRNTKWANLAGLIGCVTGSRVRIGVTSFIGSPVPRWSAAEGTLKISGFSIRGIPAASRRVAMRAWNANVFGVNFPWFGVLSQVPGRASACSRSVLELDAAIAAAVTILR
jgi:hypothetical protein